MLILLQNPEATRVAGYTTGKRMGRQVKLGEKGIFIMAPSFNDRRKPDLEDPEGELLTPRTPIRCLHVTHVFDVSQTLGDDLPPMPGAPCPEVPIDLLDMLKRLANRSGYAVHEHADPHASNGRIGADNIISVQRSLDSSTKAAVLAHEIAHHYLNHLMDKKERYLAELEAESVAYMVLYAFGVNTDLYSFGYIAAWQADQSDPVAVLRSRIRRIATAARPPKASIAQRLTPGWPGRLQRVVSRLAELP